jgi:hypothetical protein
MKVNSQIGPFSLVPEWVIERDLSPTGLKLYVVLARFADWQTGEAFPARETLADRMSCSPKTVDRAVKELVDAECIRSWQISRYASKRYQVFQVDPRSQFEPFDETDLTPDGTDLTGDGTNMSGREDTDVQLTRTNERESINKNQLTKEFDIFWSIYPRRTGKQAAKASFEKAVKAVGLDKVMDGVRALANDPNLPAEQFIPNPATWLNQGRWDDDPYPPKHVDRKPTAAERTAQLIHGARARDEQELITKGIGVGPDFGGMLKGIDG